MPISSAANCLEPSFVDTSDLVDFRRGDLMDNEQGSGHCNGRGNDEGYDEVDSGSVALRREAEVAERRHRAVSGSTQTDDFEFDTIDAAGGGGARFHRTNGLTSNENGGGSNNNKESAFGLFSNLITLVLPTKRKHDSDGELSNDEGSVRQQSSRNLRCISTQTEESPVSVRAHELCCMAIQELALENPVPQSQRDEVFEALCCCVCEILDKHSILFNGMLRRFDVTDYRVFTCIADELFEVTSSSPEFKITWGRVVSLFAFAVKLAQRHKEAHEENQLDNVVHYLSNYITRHLLDFIVSEGGWEGLVKQFPLPETDEKQMKRAMMWSGLCVGLVATMYVSSLLSK